MAKKDPIRIAVHLNGLDKDLEIKKVCHVTLESDSEFIYLEKIKGSTDWRLTYTVNTVPDIQKLQSLDIIREKP